MADLFGSAAMSGVGNSILGVVNVLGAVFVAVLVIALIIGIVYYLKVHHFAYKYPVIMQLEVGDSIKVVKDKFKIYEKGKQNEVRFKKHKHTVAEVPPDDYGFFVKRGKKAFMAFVRNEQATWVYPHPITNAVKELRTVYDPETNEEKKVIFNRAGLVTMPSNLKRLFIDQTRINLEQKHKLKWWQNPMIMGTIIVSLIFISVLFLYLINKSTVEVAKEAIRMGANVMQDAQGQVIP